MIKALWAQRKLSHTAAKSEAVQCRDRSPQLLGEIEATMQAEYRVSSDLSWRQAQLTWKSRPFKPASADELQWLQQFLPILQSPALRRSAAAQVIAGAPRPADPLAALALRRHKLLIYDGPSQMGKTERAAHWFGPANTLLIQTQSLTTPNLREWASGEYKAIVYDEGSWELVSSNKALFQSGSRPVQLSQSQCNDRAHNVVVYRCPMIVTSNCFWKGCADPDARAWIEANLSLIHI